MIQTKRAYDKPESTDGLRILVDRLWPRGIAKKDLSIDEWNKEVSPSDELRRWFAHEPERWSEFLARYFQELENKRIYWESLLKQSEDKCITLVYAAKDPKYNNAEALRHYLDSKRSDKKK